MGEYATRQSDGQRVKVGTCEQMYYLRADQLDKVRGTGSDADPERYKFDGIRFRFPFPDEDNVQPGEFEDFDRAFRVDGIEQDDQHNHYSVQFSAPNGYRLSIPCPESGQRSADRMSIAVDGLKVGLNGYGGSFGVHSQRFMREDEDGPERLVTVCRCMGCGALWRLHTWADAEPIVVALRSQADEYERRDAAGLTVYGWGPKVLHAMADRIAEGYRVREEATV